MKNYRFLMMVCAMVFFFSALKAQSLIDAKRLQNEEQYTKAIVMLKQLCKAEPANSELSYSLGKMYYEENIDDSALYFFGQTAKITPETPYTYLSAGRIALYNKNKEAAKEAFEKAISFNKKNPEIIIEAGESAVRQDTSMIGWVRELFTKNEKVCKKSARYFIVLGDINHMQGSGGNAVGQYNLAKEIDKNNPQVYLKIANVWQGARRYDLALQQLEEAEKIAPAFPPLLRELGEVKFLKGDFKSANDYYGRYLKEVGNDIEARIKKIKFLFLSKLYDEAINEINSIFEIEKNVIILYRLLGYSCFEVKKYSEGLTAMEYFMKNQNASKLMFADYSYYGRLLARNGKDSLAYPVLMKAYKFDSTDIMIWNELLMSSLTMKHFNDAIYWQYKRIYAYDNFNANEYQKVGQLYYQASDFMKADSIFSLMLQKTDTNNIPLIAWRARCFKAMDNQVKSKGIAKPYYQKVLLLSKKEMVALNIQVDEYRKKGGNDPIIAEYERLMLLQKINNGNKDELSKYLNKQISILSDYIKLKNDIAANEKNQVEAYGYLGFFYYKMKKMKPALECFNSIKRIDPSFPGIDTIIKQIEDVLRQQAQARQRQQQEQEEDAELDYLK